MTCTAVMVLLLCVLLPGWKVLARNPNGNALHQAINQANLAAFQQALAEGADVNEKVLGPLPADDFCYRLVPSDPSPAIMLHEGSA